jgi:hypothetical protein
MDYQFNNPKTPTGLNSNSHNRLVVGSNPTEPTFEAILPQSTVTLDHRQLG